MGVAVALAWLLPDPGAKGGSLHPEIVNKLGVSLIFFLHGLTLSFASMKAGARNWRLHLLVQLCTFGFFPVLGMLLVFGSGSALHPELRPGLFFLCALPSTVSSSVALTATAHGNVPGAVFNATLSSLIGVLLTPLWMAWILGRGGVDFDGGQEVGHTKVEA
jgi:sodium/bile acid cotransporter 7